MSWTKKVIEQLRDYAKDCEQDPGISMLSIPAGEVYGLADFAIKSYDAMKAIEQKLQDGVLVRDISNDAHPEWAVSMTHLVLAIKNLTDAIGMIEEEK